MLIFLDLVTLNSYLIKFIKGLCNIYYTIYKNIHELDNSFLLVLELDNLKEILIAIASWVLSLPQIMWRRCASRVHSDAHQMRCALSAFKFSLDHTTLIPRSEWYGIEKCRISIYFCIHYNENYTNLFNTKIISYSLRLLKANS